MDSVHLSGSGDVREAGRKMETAAADITRAANLFSESVFMLERVLREHAERIEAAARAVQ